MNRTLLISTPAILALQALKLGAQSVPDIPEPGIILYGQVFFNGTNTPAGISIGNWLVDDGTLSFALSASSSPGTQIVALKGQAYYITQIPLRTHTIGSGPGLVTFAGPSGANQWFQLKPTSPAYVFQPFFNGGPTTIRSVNGTAVPAGTSAVTTIGLTTAERGKMVRVDLNVSSGPDGYDVWADFRLGGHAAGNQLRGGDFDNDGNRNENEWIAGSDPTDANSGLRIISFVRDGILNEITWQSVAGKTYILEANMGLFGEAPWTMLRQVPSSGSTTNVQFESPTTLYQYYRLSVPR